jgi:hypothetical protein
MINLKCTKRLLSRVNEPPKGVLSDEPAVLGDWVGNIIPIWGGELLLFLNERTLLTLILSTSSLSDLRSAFQSQLANLLKSLRVPKSVVQAVSLEISAISLTSTDNRRMLALLRDASYYYQDVVDFVPPDRIRNQVEMEMHMADWLYGPTPYQRPIDLLTKVVQEFIKQEPR